MVITKVGNDPEADRRHRVGLGDPHDHLAVQFQQPQGIAQDDLTFHGQFQRWHRLDEQPLPEQVLQPLDLQGNGGLGEMQPLGGLGEPAAFHHRDKAAHEIEVDIGHAHKN